jgi:hypothetical protein
MNGEAAELRLAAVPEQAPVAIHIFAPDGTSLLANAAWDALWQGAVSDPEGRNVFAHPVLEAAGLVPFMLEAAAGRAVSTPPLRFEPARAGDVGEPRWLRGSLAPIADAEGRVREVVMIDEDITARLGRARHRRRGGGDAGGAEPLARTWLPGGSRVPVRPTGGARRAGDVAGRRAPVRAVGLAQRNPGQAPLPTDPRRAAGRTTAALGENLRSVRAEVAETPANSRDRCKHAPWRSPRPKDRQARPTGRP